MESRVKLLGHPIHPMLIVLPLGLLATAVYRLRVAVDDDANLNASDPISREGIAEVST